MDVSNLSPAELQLIVDRDNEWIQALNNWMPDDKPVSAPLGEENTPVTLLDSLFQNGTLKRKQQFGFGRRVVDMEP